MATNSNQEGRWLRWGRQGFDKSIKVSDWMSGYANAVSAKIGGERFWPMSNDMLLEIEKCERILRAFTVEGIPQKEEKEEQVSDGKGNFIKKKRKVLKKIPPAAIKKAKGVCIFSSMRSGIAPFGGGGGAGLVLARLPDGSWSAPSAISPNNMSAGFLLGVDFIDAVLLINTEKAMESFKTHKFTIGAETAITAGPVGAGTSAETGIERSPIYSYVRTRGMYAGVELMGQVFLDRFDENERFYYWPGIKAGDILTGKVRIPPQAAVLHRALLDAETGKAQGGKLEKTVYDIVKMPESMVIKALQDKPKASKRFVAAAPTGDAPPTPDLTPSTSKMPAGEFSEQSEVEEIDLTSADQDETPAVRVSAEEDDDDEIVHDGEKLRLPPTPQELEALEKAGIPDEEDARLEKEDRIKLYNMPAPPMHPIVQRYWRVRPELAKKRRTLQLEMDGPYGAEVREAQYVPLPPSPTLDAVNGARGEQALEQEGERARDTLVLAGERDALESGTVLEGVDEEEADRMMSRMMGSMEVSKDEEFNTATPSHDEPVKDLAALESDGHEAVVAKNLQAADDSNEHKIALVDNTSKEEMPVESKGFSEGEIVPIPAIEHMEGEVESSSLRALASTTHGDDEGNEEENRTEAQNQQEVKAEAEAATAAESADGDVDEVATDEANGETDPSAALADTTLKATEGKTESILPPPKRPPPRNRNRPAKDSAAAKKE